MTSSRVLVQQPVCGPVHFILLKGIWRKGYAGPIWASACTTPLSGQLPQLSNSWSGVRKWGSCPSEVKYITRGHISLRASELWHPSMEKGFLSKNVKYHFYIILILFCTHINLKIFIWLLKYEGMRIHNFTINKLSTISIHFYGPEFKAKPTNMWQDCLPPS